MPSVKLGHTFYSESFYWCIIYTVRSNTVYKKNKFHMFRVIAHLMSKQHWELVRLNDGFYIFGNY
jgi:hypothetical protein